MTWSIPVDTVDEDVLFYILLKEHVCHFKFSIL